LKQEQPQQQQGGGAAPQQGFSTSSTAEPQGTPSQAGSPSASGPEAGVRPEPGSSSSSADNLADTWLPHSKPVVPNYAHAGVLLALGLTGHLDRLSWTDLYRWAGQQQSTGGSIRFFVPHSARAENQVSEQDYATSRLHILCMKNSATHHPTCAVHCHHVACLQVPV
jgi:hypothetical protein